MTPREQVLKVYKFAQAWYDADRTVHIVSDYETLNAISDMCVDEESAWQSAANNIKQQENE